MQKSRAPNLIVNRNTVLNQSARAFALGYFLNINVVGDMISIQRAIHPLRFKSLTRVTKRPCASGI